MTIGASLAQVQARRARQIVSSAKIGLGRVRSLLDRQRVSAEKRTLVAASRKRKLYFTLYASKVLPNVTPISLTSPLAFELSSMSTHASATFRTDPIHNAGDHFRRCFERAQSEICHTPSGDYIQRSASTFLVRRENADASGRSKPARPSRRVPHFRFQNVSRPSGCRWTAETCRKLLV